MEKNLKSYLQGIIEELEFRNKRNLELIESIQNLISPSREKLMLKEPKTPMYDNRDGEEEETNKFKLFVQNHPYWFILILIIVVYWGLKIFLKTKGFDLNLGLGGD